MSYVEQIYEKSQKIYNFLNTKLFKFSLTSILTIFLFFGVMNAYAATATDSTTIDTSKTTISPDWKGIKSFYNLASSAEKDEDNMTSSGGLQSTNTMWTLLSFVAPGITGGADDLKNNNDVPGDMKLGLVGFSDTLIAGAYENAPSVNLAEHLQEEWVPGYNTSTTSTYAASDTAAVPGYNSLLDSGIAPLWSKMRDVAYIAFVLVMIVVGFMIMFRNKIGGQALVTLGNTIPNVIVSLVLVTFSFAIAGIVIDLGGVVISLLNSLFEGKAVAISNIPQLMSVFYHGLGSTISGLSTSLISSITSSPVKIISTAILMLSGVGVFAGAAIGAVGILVILIAIGIVLYGAIKLIIMLYKTYFELLLNVVIGPLQIMLGTFPGNEAVRMNWFLGIVRNVLVFPIAFFILNVPVYLDSIGKLTFNLPNSLTGVAVTTATTGSASLTTSGALGLITMFVIRVFILLYACQAPKFAEAILPPVQTNASKAAAEAWGNAKASMSKIPLLGGMFK